MKYDFDKIANRKNTGSIKYDFFHENGLAEDTIPLWVADMDFSAPYEVTEKLKDIASHGIFGYSDTKDSYYEAVHDWFSKYHGFETKPEWMVKTPGVVFSIATAIRSFSEEGEGILIQRPVYYPFERIIKANNRKVVNNALKYENGKYVIDFDDFERVLKNENVKLFILCSPHNPVGRVWLKEELKIMGELCLKYNVIVVADEIHCDFTYPNHQHIPFASICDDFAQNSIVCTSPSKTFNLAGLQTANIFIANNTLKQKFTKSIHATGFGGLSIFGLAACETAYRFGNEWLSQLKDYLYDNLCFAKEYLKRNLPNIRIIEPEGTYLLWLDFSGYDLEERHINDIIRQKARLWLDEGSLFGSEGKNFQRINIACPRKILKDALLRLKEALTDIK
ncbi:MAG: MalY/PatB family protein [Bacillota bacterium]|nr:MalY/PatB family protein [Bacillota bacterium]